MKDKILDILFDNDWVLLILVIGGLFLILAVLSNMSAKASKRNCEENGGVYISELSWGSKCHLKAEQK